METHPVPQNISSYEFRLVGDMTLKQFLQLAGGIVLALIIFRLPLVGIIKYPLTFLSAATSAMMAFLPVNGRPFSTWLFAFIKAIYSPTEYIWKPAPASPITPIASPVLPSEAPAKEGSTAPVVPSFSSLITSKIPNISPPTPTQTTASVIISPPPIQKPPEPVVTPPAASAPVIPPPATPPPPVQTVATPPSLQSSSVSTAPGAASTSLISPPTNPNVLAGVVTDSKGQTLTGITVEIVDTATGIPARALRTNRLGQFQIAIPLTAGTYNIITEKEGLSFDPVSIQVKGSIVPPIVISAKN